MRKLAQRNEVICPKSHSLEVADHRTKSHIFQAKDRAIYKIPAGHSVGQRTIDPMGWE